MEEDAGKSLHNQNLTDTLLDYYQCGIPLLEIVSEPDLRSGAQASHLCRKSVNYFEISFKNLRILQTCVKVFTNSLSTHLYLLNIASLSD